MPGPERGSAGARRASAPYVRGAARRPPGLVGSLLKGAASAGRALGLWGASEQAAAALRGDADGVTVRRSGGARGPRRAEPRRKGKRS